MALSRQQKDKNNAYAREYYRKHREHLLKRQREREREVRAAKSNPKRQPKSAAQRQKEYRQRHKAKVKAASLKYREKHTERVKFWRRKYHHNGMQNPAFVVVKRLRTRLNDEIRFRSRKTAKLESIVNLIGCTRDELVKYIESKFKPGMSWKNRSEWHIDHIRPVSSFDMLDAEEQKKCFHFTNLQPLWRSENCSKGDKIINTCAA